MKSVRTWSRLNARNALALTALASLAILAGSACDEDTNTSGSSSDDDASTTAASSSSSGSGGNGSGAAGTGAGTGTGAGGSGAGGGGAGTPMSGANCSPPSGDKPDGSPGFKLTPVASNLNRPVLVTHAIGDSDRIYIIEQQGRIRLLKGGTVTTFLDIEDKVDDSQNEMGFLGLAFHPNYLNNGRFFVHYSGAGNVSTVEEYKRSAGDADVADPDAVGEPYFTFNQPYGNHNGGSLEFNPFDGFLYLGLGDGGSGGDPLGSGQDTTTPLGALLRFDVSTNPPTIPAGNLTGAGVDQRIYDYGLRNPYRFSFDPCTGDRYIGDVGQNLWEEISVAANGAGNKNWGWKLKEGNSCFSPTTNCDPGNITEDPAIDYFHTGGRCWSVTGGSVYRGSAIPWMRGAYLYGEYCNGDMSMFRWNNGTVTDDQFLTNAGVNPTCFGQDNDGEMYVCAHSNGSPTSVYRIDPE